MMLNPSGIAPTILKKKGGFIYLPLMDSTTAGAFIKNAFDSLYCQVKYFFSGSIFIVYPNATSSIIIVANPSIAPTVDKSVSFPACDSGMSSSTTTNIIAPAANERA